MLLEVGSVGGLSGLLEEVSKAHILGRLEHVLQGQHGGGQDEANQTGVQAQVAAVRNIVADAEPFRSAGQLEEKCQTGSLAVQRLKLTMHDIHQEDRQQGE